MITIERYSSNRKEEWDQLIANSRNGTFLHQRDYMEYHCDRFTDYSLLAFKNNEVIALMPANISNGILYTHQGLTYGGWIASSKFTIEDTLATMLNMCSYLKTDRVTTVNYKPVPVYFQNYPYQDDLFALSLLNAQLTRLDTSYILDNTFPHNFQNRRIRSMKKAVKNKVRLSYNCSLEKFWNDVLIPHLHQKYVTKPVHSLAEITSLQKRFPENIVQCNAFIDDKLVAGATVYLNNSFAHTQYIASTDEGRDSGAIDLLFHWMITERFKSKRYFSFGTSNNSGNDLNTGVAEWKSGWGAYTSPHFTFSFNTDQTASLQKIVYR